MRQRVTRNAIQCNNCLSVIESKHRHDFRWCACGDVAVDGGLDYVKISARPNAMFIDLSEYEE